MALSRRRKYHRSYKKENDQSSFYGSILKEARLRNGLDLDEVSKELHIRTDILLALEEGDFSQIPPQGYSRNMVKTYSRMLGLDANKLTNMFLDSEYSFQVNKKRLSAQKMSEENRKRVPDITTSRGKTLTPRDHIEHSSLLNNNTNSNINDQNLLSAKKNPKRSFHTYENKYKNTPRQRGSFDTKINSATGRRYYRNTSSLNNDLLNGDDQDSARQRLASRKKQNSRNTQSNDHQNPYKQAKIGFGALKQRHTLSRGNSYNLTDEENPNSIKSNQTKVNLSGGNYNFMKIQNHGPSPSQSRLAIPIIAGAVVLLIVVLIIVFFLVGKQHENDKTDVSKLNVVGISDIENSNKNDNQNSKANENAQVEQIKELEFKYKVKTGQTVYMEIYEGSNSRPTLAREVKSDETNTFKVTDKLTFVTSNPNNVEIFINNETVTPQQNKNGIYTYVVDFNQYIQE